MLKVLCQKDFAVIGQFCAKIKYSQNAPVKIKLKRRYQMNSGRANHDNLFGDFCGHSIKT